MLLHTKETDTVQYFNEAPAIPDRPRFHWSMLCCSVPCCRQTGAVMMKRRPRLLIKKTPPFPLQITVLRENYTGKKAPSLQPRLRDALLLYWKCQIKHTVGGALMQRVQKNDYKTCLMEMIDRLLTDKDECSFCSGMWRSLGRVVYLQMCSRTLNLVKASLWCTHGAPSSQHFTTVKR